MRKKSVVILAVIVAVISFLGLIALERTIIKMTPTMKVIYCVNDVKRKDPLNKSNFVERNVPINLVSLSSAVKSMDEINGLYAIDNIYSNEILNRSRIGTLSEVESYKLNKGEQEFSLSFDSIADCVAGILRKDDIIYIYLSSAATLNSTVSKTQVEVKGVRVLGAKDNAGNYIDKFDKNASATTLLLAGSTEMVSYVYSLQAMGKLKITKASDEENTTRSAIIMNGNGVVKK